MLDKIKSSANYVSKNSSYVKINYSKIDQIIKDFDANFSFWVEANPFGVID